MQDNYILIMFSIILFALSTGYVFYTLQTGFLSRRRRIRTGGKLFENNSIWSVINHVMKRVFSLSGKQKVKDKIERAGFPYRLTYKKYYVWKITLAFIFSIVLGSDHSFVLRFTYAFLGFMVLDLLLFIHTKRKEVLIRDELPDMIDIISRSLSAGVPMKETLVLLAKRLKGPLATEVALLATQYQLEGNMERGLQRFQERLAIKEVDHLCLALRQGEQSGRMKGMLDKQSHMLKRLLHFQQTISTRNRANFLPLVTVGMVINILLLTVVPMVLMIMSNGQRFQ